MLITISSEFHYSFTTLSWRRRCRLKYWLILFLVARLVSEKYMERNVIKYSFVKRSGVRGSLATSWNRSALLRLRVNYLNKYSNFHNYFIFKAVRAETELTDIIRTQLINVFFLSPQHRPCKLPQQPQSSQTAAINSHSISLCHYCPHIITLPAGSHLGQYATIFATITKLN